LQAWRLTGDVYSKKRGDKPWISEMYGYSFGAAKAGVWHKYDEESMLYPSYMPNGEGVGQQGSFTGMLTVRSICYILVPQLNAQR
jgi:hypothetical protein